MFKRKILILSLVTSILCSAFALMLPAATHAAVIPHTANLQVASNCHITEIIYHGSSKPLSTSCLQVQQKSNATTGPRTVTSGHNCPSDYLLIYYNGPFGSAAANSGPVLCLFNDSNSGVWLFNLTMTVGGTYWNDVASAWWMGCENADFYSDINANGATAGRNGTNFGANAPSGNFPLQDPPSPAVNNDALSSVQLFGGAHSC